MDANVTHQRQQLLIGKGNDMEIFVIMMSKECKMYIVFTKKQNQIFFINFI